MSNSSSIIDGFTELSAHFGQYHQDPTNVFLHFVTTPAGLIGIVSIMHIMFKSYSSVFCLIAVYLLSLLPTVPNGVFVGTLGLCGLIVYSARQLKLGAMSACVFILISYLVQDLSHLGTGEETFQSTYSDGGHIDFARLDRWAKLFFEHCYYLLPLCVHSALPFLMVPPGLKAVLEAPVPDEMQHLHAFAWLLGPLIFFALGSYCLDSKNGFCFFPGTPYFHRVLRTTLFPTINSECDSNHETVSRGGALKVHESRRVDLATIREWTMAQSPSPHTSSHWWYTELNGEAKEAFDRCVNSSQICDMFRSLFGQQHYCLDALQGMNEIYVTGPAREEEASNSDHVFYTRHVDGPMGLVPFVSVYRCLVGLDKNYLITTHCPLANVNMNVVEGDVLAFDFNREVHYISRDESKKSISDDFRVTLKVHYCVYPRVLAPLGWLFGLMNTAYNMSFRALFLKTINPSSYYEHFLAWNVNFNTVLFDRIETYIGQRNLIYLFFVLALWRATGVYEVFFALTSFVHYFRYITTFYVRRGIDFGSFKRDVLLFKTIALVQLFYHYLFPQTMPFSFDPVSVGMIACGYAVSVAATSAIGVDRTYFAAELGLVEPKWISQFPYGYIPHPMIVSQIFALLGLYKAAHFRAEWPYVVPMHVMLYLVHMLQEHFDVYLVYPNQLQSSNKKIA